MNYFDVKSELIQIRIIQQAYKLAKEKAYQFDDMIGNPKVSGFDERIQNSTGENALERKIVLALSYHESVKVLEDKMIQAREQCEMFISVLELQSEREVITRRYLMCETWESIASNMHYSERQIFRIHRKALTRLSEFSEHFEKMSVDVIERQ